MKQVFFIIALIFSIGLSSCTSPNQESDLSVKLKNDRIILFKSDTAYLDITITSNSKKPVEIIKIVGTCGCTVVSGQFSKTLKKGDSTKVSIKYIPSPEDIGSVKKEILIYTNGQPMLYEVFLKFDVK